MDHSSLSTVALYQKGTIDSELFGHEKGSFTGASDNRKGYFETVNGGTIFLDEIAEMPLGTQSTTSKTITKWGVYQSRRFTSTKNRCARDRSHQCEFD
jgi:DNA-binding NtrC family response regulator